MNGPRRRARCPGCGAVMVVHQRAAHVEAVDGPLEPDGTVPFTFPAHPPGADRYCDGWGRRVEAAWFAGYPELTAAQQHVVDFIGRAGPATWLAVSAAMWGRRRRATAETMLVRLAGMGVVQLVPAPDGLMRYELTATGQEARTGAEG